MQKNSFQKFVNDESGAVTIDWVVLTMAAVVGVCLACMPMMSELDRGAANIAYVVSVGEMPEDVADSGSSGPQTMD